MRVMEIPIVIGVLGTVPKDLERELEESEIGGQIETIQNYSITKVSKNTEKRPAEICCHLDFSERPPALAGGK